MSIEADLFAKLQALVANRVYPVTFPQDPHTPAWPAIRYTFVSVEPALALCGDSGDKSATSRTQIDAVATSYDAMRTLRSQVMSLMKTFTPPAVLDTSREDYDKETKTFRASLDYLVYASSPAP